MSRLPVPGGDSGSWGNVLNDFLAVEHNPDGSLKKAADIADAKTKADGAVQTTQIGAVNGVAPLNGSGKVPNTVLSGVALVDGTVQTITEPNKIQALTNLGTARIVTLEQFGGSISATAAQNDAAISAAITALGTTGGTIFASGIGIYQFAAAHDFNNADLVGCGGGTGVPATTFKATAAAAQFNFSNGGSITGNFQIDGNSIAHTPFLRAPYTAASSGRVFQSITVSSNANDGTGTNALAMINGAQNDIFQQCTFRLGANDLLWIDGGMGGTSFERCEFVGAGRYHIRFDNTISNPFVYTMPSDIEFNNCIIEGNGGVSQVIVKAGYDIKFDGTDFFSENVLSGPSIDIAGGTHVVIGNASIQQVGAAGLQAGTIGLRVSGTSRAITFGRLAFNNLDSCILLVGGAAFIDAKHSADYFSCATHLAVSGGALATQAATYFDGTQFFRSQYSSNIILASFNNGQNGLKFSYDSEGKLSWYTGASGAFSPDVSIQRRGAGSIGMSGACTIGTGAGTSVQQLTPAVSGAGGLYLNTDDQSLEYSDGTSWLAPQPYGAWHPADNGFIGASFDPAGMSTAYASLSAGLLQIMAVKVPAGKAITNVVAFVGTAGSGLTAGTSCLAAVYDGTGTRLGVSSDQATAWQSTGLMAMALTAPVAAQTKNRTVYVALIAAGTTLPQFGYNGGNATGSLGLSVGPFPSGYISGQATAPASINMATMVGWFKYWIGLS
ncbi:MAG: hypothetical protein WC498_03545 [Candidatus Saccharimonadales bacterium]